MARTEILAGLDVGSAQAVVVIGRKDDSNGMVTVLGSSRVACRGLKGGVVINIPESRQAIQRAVEEAEKQAGVTVQDLLVSVRGSHVETLNNRGAVVISRTDKEITAEDVENVINTAKAIQLSNDREIIHTVPQDFSVDKQPGVEDPVGMEGSHLAVDVHIAVASSSHLSNIVKSINLAGFNYRDIIYGAFAVGDSVVSDEEKDLGVALMDLGGQTSNLAIYADGSVRYTKELPIGGELITKDITHGLRTSFTVAQELKENYGAAMCSLLTDDESIEFTSVDGRARQQVARRTLVEIIQNRLEEILEIIYKELQKSNYLEMIPGGIVLTGGCSKLHGIDKAVEEVFGINVHQGGLIGVEGPAEIVNDPGYATAIGLLRYRHVGEWSKGIRSHRPTGFTRKLKTWMDELF